jgi:hypothetical protein
MSDLTFTTGWQEPALVVAAIAIVALGAAFGRLMWKVGMMSCDGVTWFMIMGGVFGHAEFQPKWPMKAEDWHEKAGQLYPFHPIPSPLRRAVRWAKERQSEN